MDFRQTRGLTKVHRIPLDLTGISIVLVPVVDTSTHLSPRKSMSDASKAHAASFDWTATYFGERNRKCIYHLYRNRPDTIFLALELQRKQHWIQLFLRGPSFLLCPSLGLYDFRLHSSALEAAKVFEKHMLSSRNTSGILVGTNGVPTPGYNTYDSLVVDLQPFLQQSRTVIPQRGKPALYNFIEYTPGLLVILQEVLHQFGVGLDDWKQYIAGFHGLVADASKQTAFAWHSDTEDIKGLRPDVITVIVQCTDDVTAMRILGCKPFYFDSAGHVAAFFGHAAHQSIPWKDPINPLRSACKAVFFLHPMPGVNSSLTMHAHERVHLTLEREADRIACMQFVLKRRDLEFEEVRANIPQKATMETTSSSSITCIKESSLSSLWCALSGPLQLDVWQHGQPEFYIRWTVSHPRTVTGVVWYSVTKRSSLLYHLYGIAAFKGEGVPLHEAFCRFLVSCGCERIEAPMPICRIKRGRWLQSLGWRLSGTHSGLQVRDGDLLFLDLTVERESVHHLRSRVKNASMHNCQLDVSSV